MHKSTHRVGLFIKGLASADGTGFVKQLFLLHLLLCVSFHKAVASVLNFFQYQVLNCAKTVTLTD